jgi:hypothetical protein
MHDHVHGLPPPPDTDVALPELHSPLVGAVMVAAPSAEPQLPLVDFLASAGVTSSSAASALTICMTRRFMTYSYY